MERRRKANILDRLDERVAIPVVLAVFALLVAGATGIAYLQAQARVEPALAASDEIGSQGGASFVDGEAQDAIDPALAALLGEAPASTAADEDLHYLVRKVKPGDTVWDISLEFGVSMDAIFSMNDIPRARSLRIGQMLKIPSINGIVRKAKDGDTPASLAEAFGVSPERVLAANRISSLDEKLLAGQTLFLPDASLPRSEMGERTGDLFRWPYSGRITSWYGWRRDPFSGRRSFHGALDIGGARGSAVRAAMPGRVTQVGFSTVLGNYVMLAHVSGYTSLYGHMDSTSVTVGQSVGLGQKLGALGSTGYSTGPHVHFAVFKYGRPLNPVPLLY